MVKPKRILIAEDETLIRLDLSEMLREAGYEVIAEASDGEEAIEQAEMTKPDLAILDVRMPKLDGISAAEKIVKICPTLMLTAFSQRDLVEGPCRDGLRPADARSRELLPPVRFHAADIRFGRAARVALQQRQRGHHGA